MESNSNERLKTGDAETGAKEQNNGRFALALSGGGFRASFFHIGVLAALADLGILHKIEVISGVSGGSIIAAYYYLKVKEKLKSKWDPSVSPSVSPTKDEVLNQADYIGLIKDIEETFLKNVQKNIRMRVFANLWSNVKMGFLKKYSRSTRIAELYDKFFYEKEKNKKNKKDNKFAMRELKIIPKGSDGDFDPRKQNEPREFKVPILKINASTLNTGHNWTFEAKHMGEPPRTSKMEKEIDKNMRLRRPTGWDKTIDELQDFKLGHAVSASACVPGLFHPLPIYGMYEEHRINEKDENIAVQLVDGGVHDNLGIAAISKVKEKNDAIADPDSAPEYCNKILISDASGQLEDDPDPSTSIISVIGRMNGILMDRVREEELFRLYEECKLLEECKKPSKQFWLMHLRKGLPREVVEYKLPQKERSKKQKITGSNTPSDPAVIRDLLSRIRTDLDSFTQVEAYSLMYDAYSMTKRELQPNLDVQKNSELDSGNDSENTWEFQKVEPLFKDQPKKFIKHLKVGGRSAFKLFSLNPPAAWILLILTLFIIAIPFYIFRSWFSEFIICFISRPIGYYLNWNTLIFIGIPLILGFISPLSKWLKFLKILRKPSRILVHIFTRFGLPTIATAFMWWHLITFDYFFKRAGRIDKFMKK